MLTLSFVVLDPELTKTSSILMAIHALFRSYAATCRGRWPMSCFEKANETGGSDELKA